MTIFFDTSVLVAASVHSHVHFPRAHPALARVVAAQDKGYMCLHSVAEVYSSLTRLPLRPRIHPAEAARILRDDILPQFELVPMERDDYLHAITAMADGSWVGAKIYDALILRCAARSGAERIYTFNLTDFRQLAPPELASRICAP